MLAELNFWYFFFFDGYETKNRMFEIKNKSINLYKDYEQSIQRL